MPPRNCGTPTPKKPAEMVWDAINDRDYVAEDGWEEEEEPWTYTTCKNIVKMKHLLKLWPDYGKRKKFEIRLEGLLSNIDFTLYFEVNITLMSNLNQFLNVTFKLKICFNAKLYQIRSFTDIVVLREIGFWKSQGV